LISEKKGLFLLLLGILGHRGDTVKKNRDWNWGRIPLVKKKKKDNIREKKERRAKRERKRGKPSFHSEHIRRLVEKTFPGKRRGRA